MIKGFCDCSFEWIDKVVVNSFLTYREPLKSEVLVFLQVNFFLNILSFFTDPNFYK